jgi:rhodanese-related sulfurtransferase
VRFRWEFGAAGVALLLAVGLVFSDAGKGSMGGGWGDEHAAAAAPPATETVEAGPFGIPEISADELAAALMAGDPGLVVLDVRAGDEAPSDRIPLAYWMPLSDPAWRDTPLPFAEHRRLVLVTADGTAEQTEAAWRPIATLGFDRAVVLTGGMTGWTRRFVDVIEPHEAASAEAWDDYRMRQAVALYLAGGVDALTAGSASAGASRPAVAPPPLPVRTASAQPKAAEGC